MNDSHRSLSVGVVIGLIAAAFTGIVTLLLVTYGGVYNIAASEDHTSFGRWALTMTMENSIQARADSVKAPEHFSDQMVAAGAPEYKAMCEHCHGGPGVKPDKWSRGMLPQPPHLPEVISEWKPNEVFWIVKHGIKMTGMPSFGENHDDQMIWNIAAFASRLPAMTKEEYQGYEETHRSGSGSGH